MINTTPFINYSGNVFIGLGQAINQETGGVFGVLVLVGFYIITFLPGLRFGEAKAFAVSSFVGVIVAILLRLMNWIFDPFLYIAIVLALIGIVILKFQSD